MEQKKISQEIPKVTQTMSLALLSAQQRDEPVNAEKIEQLKQKIKAGDSEYYHIHQDLKSDNRQAMTNLAENKEMIFKTLWKEIPSTVSFVVELYKPGKTFSSLRSRWAFIIRDQGLFSSGSKTFEKTKCKDKTDILLKSSLKSETKSQNSGSWSNSKKEFRIVLEYIKDPKSNKISSLYLYFDSESQLEECKSLLEGIKLIKKNTGLEPVKAMTQMTEGSHLLYGIQKILEVKQKVKRKKLILYSLSEKVKSISNPFYNFARNFASNVRTNMRKKLHSIVKWPTFPEKKFLFAKAKQEPQGKEFISSQDITSKKNKISNFFKMIQPKLSKTQNKTNLTNPNIQEKQIGFKVINSQFYCQNSSPNKLSANFNPNEFMYSKLFTMNKKKLEIKFSEKCQFSQEDILNISNVFWGIDLKNARKQNTLVINGPKIDRNKFLKYSLSNSSESFTEPEYFDQKNTNNSIKNLNLQIFHILFSLDKKDFDYLETLNSYKIKFSDPLNDCLFYIQVQITNRSNSYKFKTKLMRALKLDDKGGFILEVNQERLVLSEYQETQSLEVEVRLYMLHQALFSDRDLQDEVKTNFLADFMHPYLIGEIKIKDDLSLLTRKEFRFLSPNKENDFILMNFFTSNEIGSQVRSQQTKKFYVGQELLSKESFDKSLIDSLMNYELIDQKVKDRLFDIKFSSDGNILLRPNISEEGKLWLRGCPYKEGMIFNNKFKFLPQMYKDNSGNWVHKVPTVSSYFLSSLNGVTTSGKVNYYNYYMNQKQSYEIAKFYDNSKFKFIQENIFSVYELHNYTSIENSENYSWRLELNFYNELEVRSFLTFLKQIRRKAEFANRLMQPLKNNNINLNSLISFSNNVFKDVISLNLIFKSLEFRQNFILDEDKKMKISVSSVDSSDEKSNNNKNLVEFLDESDKLGWKNSLCNLNEVSSQINSIRLLKLSSQSLPINYKLSQVEFNSSEKNFKFSENETSVLNLEIKPSINKNYEIEVLLTGIKSKSLKGYLELEKLLNLNKIVDSLFIPIMDENKIVNGIINLHILSGNKNLNTASLSSREVFDKIMEENIIKNYMNNKEGFILPKIYIEPNVFRRLTLREIRYKLKKDIKSIINSEDFNSVDYRRKLYDILSAKCIKNRETLLSTREEEYKSTKWTDLVVDISELKVKIIKKSLISLRRSDFYREFARSEWDFFFNNVFNYLQSEGERSYREKTIEMGVEYYNPGNPDYQGENSKVPYPDQRMIIPVEEIKTNRSEVSSGYRNVKNVFSLFPTKKDLLRLKKKDDKLYEELRFLIYLGLPTEGRWKVWERLLDIKVLVALTVEEMYKRGIQLKNSSEYIAKDKINPIYLDSLKLDAYEYFKDETFKPTKYNINFSLIDNDLNFLAESDETLLKVREIAKAFFVWGELSILTDPFIKNESSYFSTPFKFVHFSGLLKLISSLMKVFQDESQTFWTIVGLSQIIEVFYQSDPLITSNLSYTQMYVLTSKLIMEKNLTSIHKLFLSLGFPIEYFISSQISSLFADTFQSDLFMRVLDIIIFSASLKTDTADRYDYLRIICTIPLTLMKMNEKKILACNTIEEIDYIFSDLNRKAFNQQLFLENLRENKHNFYEYKYLLEKFIDYNPSTSWDSKRAKIEKKLIEFYAGIVNENMKISKEFYNVPSSNALPQNFVNVYENSLMQIFPNMRGAYSKGTLFSDSTTNQTKHAIDFLISDIFIHDMTKFSQLIGSQTKSLNLSVLFETSSTSNFKVENLDLRSKPLRNISVNLNEDSVNYSNRNNLLKIQPFEFNLKVNSLPEYLHILLFERNNLLGHFYLRLSNFDLMKVYGFQLESSKGFIKSSLKVNLFRHTTVALPDEESQIFNKVFASPIYQYDFQMEELMNGFKIPSADIIEAISKVFYSNNLYVNLIKKETNLSSNFIIEEFKKHNMTGFTEILKTTPQKIPPEFEKLKQFIETVTMNKKSSEKIIEILSEGNSSLEEILFTLVLIDKSSVTIYEKLKLLFDIARMKNFYINNEETISVSKLKEVIYSLYKRYQVYFTRKDIDNLIDYTLTKGSFTYPIFVGLYKESKQNEVEAFIRDRDDFPKDVKKLFIKKLNNTSNKENYKEVRKNFNYLTSLLINKYSLSSLPLDVFSNLYSYLNDEKKVPSEEFEKLRIEMNEGNIVSSKIFDLEKSLDNTTTLIKSDELKNLKNLSNETSTLNVFSKILSREASAIPLNANYDNNNTQQISFDKFKDLFFNLPLISDLIRASLAFNSSSSHNEYMKTFETVFVELSYMDGAVIRNYKFTKDSNKQNKNSNNSISINQTLDISQKVDTSMSIRDILDLLSHYERNQEISYYLRNPKLLTFLVINRKNQSEEKMKYFDPLYSNNYIRTNHENSELKLAFKIGNTEDCTRLEGKYVTMQQGWAKLKIVGEDFKWKQCRFKKIGQDNDVKFKQFSNQCKIF